MSIPLTTAHDLDRHLAALGLSEHRNVVVHSRLVSFGRIDGGVATVYEALRRAIGPEGTIAVPTYTFDLRPDQPYDRSTTPSMGTGVLSEYTRRLPGAVRSGCPIHSHAAVGPAAALLAGVPGDVSFGPGSDFDVFRQAGFSLLLLGCDFHEGATFIHHVEAQAGTPYRDWLDLTRTVIAGGVARQVVVRYCGRSSPMWIEDHHTVQKAMETAGLLRAVECPFGESYLVTLADMESVVTGMLVANPYALVRRLPNPFELVADALECDTSTLSVESGLNAHPQWDSLGHATVLMKLEAAYGVQVDAESVRRFERMTSIIELHERLALGADGTTGRMP